MNKEELKEQLNFHMEACGKPFNKYTEGLMEGYETATKLIDQLDEPREFAREFDRVLLKHIHDIYDQYGYDYLPGFINDIKDGLAKLKEPEKPVVPDFVADFIKNNKGRLNVYGGLDDVQNNQGSEMWEWVFYNHNQDEFAEAWLAYPNIEVGKEQKYHVNILDEGTGAYLIYYPKSGNYGVTGILDDNKGITRFTEQEIKDYDERFWPFAVPVEE